MNLDQFIQSRSSDGKFDSVGEFSVDSLAALRTTLASALPEPHYYLFQVLQSLVRAGATGIKVGIGMRENTISFSDPERRYADLGALAERFTQGLSVASNHPFDLLISGMTTSLGSHMGRASLIYQGEKLSISLDGLTRSSARNDSEGCAVVFRRVVEKGLSFSWSRVWGARKEEFRIRKSFEHSPSPISIAGLPTVPHSSWRRGVDAAEEFVLVEAAVLSPDSPNHRGEPQINFRRAPGSTLFYLCRPGESGPRGTELAVAPNLLMMALDEDGTPVEGDVPEAAWDSRRWSVCFTSHTDREPEVLFIRNGCSIERICCDLGFPGLQVVAPADDLAVDASGYQLIRDDALELRQKEARRLAHAVARTLRESDLSSLLAHTGRQPEDVLSRFDWLRS